MALILVLVVLGCSPAESSHASVLTTGHSIPLNGRIEVRLDGDLDPLTVNRRAVVVQTVAGEPLLARRRTDRGRLVVELEIDPTLALDPPSELELVLMGGPSVHALATTDGRRLGRTHRLRFELRPELEGGPPRLVGVGGRPLPLVGPLDVGSTVILEFEGPLDPKTVTPEACPLRPIAEGLVLDPILPSVDWRCRGQSFRLELGLGGTPGDLELSLARFGIRGLRGERPEPTLKVRLSAS